MAIQPIDLQTLFTQVDKVGKAQSAQREGLALQQTIQGAHIEKKTEAHIQSVNEAQSTGDGAEKVNDRGSREQEPGGDGRKRQDADEAQAEAETASVFRDPHLGKTIDICL